MAQVSHIFDIRSSRYTICDNLMAPSLDEGDLRSLTARALRAARNRAGSGEGARSEEFLRDLETRLGKLRSRQTYSRWENGHAAVPAEVLVAAAEIAQTTVDSLLRLGTGSPDAAEWRDAIERRLSELERRVAGS